MNSTIKLTALATFVVSMGAGTLYAGDLGGQPRGSRVASSSPEIERPARAPSGYAEKIYADFSRYAGGKVTFRVSGVEGGPLSELDGLRMSEIVGKAKAKLSTFPADRAIENPKFVPVGPKFRDTPDADQTTASLEESGYPTANGVYRLLSVRAKVGDAVQAYSALEVCWEGHKRCYVYDPVVDFVDWQVNRLRVVDGTINVREVLQKASTRAFITCVINGTGLGSRTWSLGSRSASVYSSNTTGTFLGTVNVASAYAKVSCASTFNGNCYAIINDRYANVSGTANLASGASRSCDYIAGSQTAADGTFAVWARTGCAIRSTSGAVLDYGTSGSGTSTRTTITSTANGVRENVIDHRGLCRPQ